MNDTKIASATDEGTNAEPPGDGQANARVATTVENYTLASNTALTDLSETQETGMHLYRDDFETHHRYFRPEVYKELDQMIQDVADGRPGADILLLQSLKEWMTQTCTRLKQKIFGDSIVDESELKDLIQRSFFSKMKAIRTKRMEASWSLFSERFQIDFRQRLESKKNMSGNSPFVSLERKTRQTRRRPKDDEGTGVLEEPSNVPLHQTIPSKLYPEGHQHSEAVMNAMRDRIKLVLRGLTYRQREIIKLRYGLGDGWGYTLEEIAGIFKISMEGVRKIEVKAMGKLRAPKLLSKLRDFAPKNQPLEDLMELQERMHE